MGEEKNKGKAKIQKVPMRIFEKVPTQPCSNPILAPRLEEKEEKREYSFSQILAMIRHPGDLSFSKFIPHPTIQHFLRGKI